MRILYLATIVVMTASAPAAAETAGSVDSYGKELDVSFSATRTRLAGDGYSEVAMVNGSDLYLSAFDPQGSQVLLTIDPKNGRIDSSSYIHFMDE